MSQLGFKILIPLIAAIFSLQANAFGQESNEQLALQSFEKKVSEFEEFFNQRPMLVYKQHFSKSPSGFHFCYHRYKLVEINYDVKKTNSIVSPFFGNILITYLAEDNESCGETMSGSIKGYSTFEEAKRYRDNEACFKPNKYVPQETVSFSFAFQNKKWIFKDVIRVEYGNYALAISAALGKPQATGVSFTCEDNQAWEDLVK